MKIRLVGFLGLLSFVLCVAIPRYALAQVLQKSERQLKIDKRRLQEIELKKQTPKRITPRTDIWSIDPRILEKLDSAPWPLRAGLTIR